MSKRFQPLKEFGRSAKKPKLEISINKAKSNNDQKIHNIFKQQDQIDASLWDDNEDDVILLATQVAESEIAANKQSDITESEVTFSSFDLKSQQHSTQRSDDLSKLFLEEDDDIFDDFVHIASVVDKANKKSASDKEANIFKKPELPQSSKTVTTINKNPFPASQLAGFGSSSIQELPHCSKAIKSSEGTDHSAAGRLTLTSERQVKMLTERLEAMKQENAKLNKDLNEVKDKMQEKSGEASVLRDELRYSKQQLEKLKMDKILVTESVNEECKTKIDQLSKEVKAKETQLQLKSMECSVLKMRQIDESRRLEHSVRDNFDELPNTTMVETAITADAETDETNNFEEWFENMCIIDDDCTPIPITIESYSTVITDDTFKQTEESGTVKKVNTFFQNELENLQRIFAQLEHYRTFTENETMNQFVESVKKVFSEFWAYANTLAFDYHEDVLPYHTYDIIEDKSNRPHGCLHKTTKMYDGERGISLRRYIALLSLICEKYSEASHILLQTKHEEYLLLQIAIDAINKLGFTSEICEHFGVLESFATLLRSLLLHLDLQDFKKNAPYFELIFSLLKELVFTRPSPWVFRELIFTVLECKEKFPNIVMLFCVNSPQQHFKVDRFNSTYQFSSDSCFLQVYCGLLESAFPLYRRLDATQFDLQVQLCLFHVRFVFYCLTDPPHFVQTMLPCDEDWSDEESDDPAENCDEDDIDDDYYNFFPNNRSCILAEIRKLQNEKINMRKSGEETKKIVINEGPSTSKSASNQKYSFDETASTSRSVVQQPIVLDETPSTSKKAANTSVIITNPAADDSTFKDTEENSTSKDRCMCFTQLCLSVVSMIWLTLRQWLRMNKSFLTKEVGVVSRVAIHLLHIIFCDHFLTCLFRENEDTTKHYLYLLCDWWTDNSKELEFNEIQLNFLKKLKSSHIIPKTIYEEEPKLENIASDLAQWRNLTNDDSCPTEPTDSETILESLRIEEDMFNPDIFFENFNTDFLDYQNLKDKC